jgi:murein DD-endopeptidase MepM/ murein hydrolase activator NlpD
MRLAPLVGLLLLAVPAVAEGPFLWPIDCIPGKTCDWIGYPDPDGNNEAFNCERPNYRGHKGTDIVVSHARANEGVDVYAAAAGRVLWVFDGKFDGCPSDHSDCAIPADDWFVAGASNGVRVCTDPGPWCKDSKRRGCFWCFDGGNVVVVQHEGIANVFATRYDHFKTDSILVEPGETVDAGQKIGEVGSAGRSTFSVPVVLLTHPALAGLFSGQNDPGIRCSIDGDA